MVSEVVLAQCGVQFDEEALKRANLIASAFDVAQGQLTLTPRLRTPALYPDSSQADPTSDAENGNGNGAAGLHLHPSTKSRASKRSASPGPIAKRKAKEKEVEVRESDDSERSATTDDNADTTPVDPSVNQDWAQPVHDELSINKAWWLLEILPTGTTYQAKNGKWRTKWRYVLYCYFLAFLQRC